MDSIQPERRNLVATEHECRDTNRQIGHGLISAMRPRYPPSREYGLCQATTRKDRSHQPIRPRPVARSGRDPGVDQGLLTYDPNTGLQWLDVTQSVGRDYNDVSSQFGVGGDFYGYRYATAGELGGLFADGGLVIAEGCCGGEGSPLALYETQGLALIGLVGNTGSSYTYGITGDRPCDDIFLCANAAPSPLDDKPNLGFLAVGGSVTAAPHHSWDLDEHDPNFNYNDTGSFWSWLSRARAGRHWRSNCLGQTITVRRQA
jgi:hypothetical protein